MTDDTKKPSNQSTPVFETSTGTRPSKPTQTPSASNAPKDHAPAESVASEAKKPRAGLAGAAGAIAGTAALAGAGTAAAQLADAASSGDAGHEADLKGVHDASGSSAAKGIGGQHITDGVDDDADAPIEEPADDATDAPATSGAHHSKAAHFDDQSEPEPDGDPEVIDPPVAPVIDVVNSVNVNVNVVVNTGLETDKPFPMSADAAAPVVDDKPPFEPPVQVEPTMVIDDKPPFGGGVNVEPSAVIDDKPPLDAPVEPTVPVEPVAVDPAVAPAPVAVDPAVAPEPIAVDPVDPVVIDPIEPVVDEPLVPDGPYYDGTLPGDPALVSVDATNSLDLPIEPDAAPSSLQVDVRVDSGGHIVATAHAQGDAPPIVLNVQDAEGNVASLQMDSASPDGDAQGTIDMDHGVTDVSGIVTGGDAIISAQLDTAAGDSAAVTAAGDGADVAITADDSGLAADGFADGLGATVELQGQSAEGDELAAIAGANEGSATINVELGVDGIDTHLQAEGVGTFGGAEAYDAGGDEPLEPELEADDTFEDDGLGEPQPDDDFGTASLEPEGDPLAVALSEGEALAPEPELEPEPDSLEPFEDPGVDGQMLEPDDHMTERQEGLGERDFSDYADPAPDDLDS